MTYDQTNGKELQETIRVNCSTLLNEVKEKVRKLKSYGVRYAEIEATLYEEDTLSTLIITKDYRIIIDGIDRQEVHLEPLVKSVYLLFLKHPEGIIFKHLPDYRKELSLIYQEIKPQRLNERAIQSIEDVTNPCLNSINEKCARIRAAFISKFDAHLAKNYYITGERGEAKKIALPRDLVIWE